MGNGNKEVIKEKTNLLVKFDIWTREEYYLEAYVLETLPTGINLGLDFMTTNKVKL